MPRHRRERRPPKRLERAHRFARLDAESLYEVGRRKSLGVSELYAHVCKMETLREDYQMARSNDGAPGTDGITFEAVQQGGVERCLEQIRAELVTHTDRLRFCCEKCKRAEMALNGGELVGDAEQFADELCLSQEAAPSITTPVESAATVARPAAK